MDKKYELLKEDCIKHEGRTLYRIRALRDWRILKAGDLGGYIEKEENLSHEGRAWVADDAKVYGEAQVCGQAWVYGSAEVCGEAQVSGEALVCDQAQVSGKARVFGEARVRGRVRIGGFSRIGKDTEVNV